MNFAPMKTTAGITIGLGIVMIDCGGVAAWRGGIIHVAATTKTEKRPVSDNAVLRP
jgi:hypothetical protein